MTEARSLALEQLSRGDESVRTAPASLTMLEFHWPDSAIGPWGDPNTFLQMLPRMQPEV